MTQVMVRYKVKPERVDENEPLVRAVYDEIRRTEPAGLAFPSLVLGPESHPISSRIRRSRLARGRASGDALCRRYPACGRG